MAWQLKESDLKKYPHFDPLISVSQAEALVTNQQRVTAHTFYPFLRYAQRWNRYAKKDKKGEPKKPREIRYAARADAYIFSYYRSLLSEKYEVELARLGLGDCVLAYRRIPSGPRTGGKCNIHFARDAVIKIQKLGNCCVIILDISSYFESLDHARLKALWCRLLGVSRLPGDHFKVFEAITRYAVVDKEKVYERLGHYGVKRHTKGGKPINGYLTPYKRIPKQLCTGAEFRKKIAGEGALRSIIEKHIEPFGIPQGAPLSDLLANLYLLDFDIEISAKVQAVGGVYYRYSDDILIAVPGNDKVGLEFEDYVQKAITRYGGRLQIKKEKTSVFRCTIDSERQKVSLIKGEKGKDGIAYLGFRYDGHKVYLRNGTISNLYRKVTRSARREANALARRYPNKTVSELSAVFNYDALIKKFSRVEGFENFFGNHKKWTFWTYATRAAEVFGDIGKPILRQLKRHRTHIMLKAGKELVRAVQRRDGNV